MFTYRPLNIGQLGTLDEVARVLNEEFSRIAEAFNRFPLLQMQEVHVEPTKPRSGLVVFADGTDWDPGSGRGFYYYDQDLSAWQPFGSGGGGGGYTDEQVRDVVGGALIAGPYIDIVVNDPGDQITISGTGDFNPFTDAYDAGTLDTISGTILDFDNGIAQKVVNNGASGFYPPALPVSYDSTKVAMEIFVLNGPSAGVLDTGPFDTVVGAFTDTPDDIFLARATWINSFSLLEIFPLGTYPGLLLLEGSSDFLLLEGSTDRLFLG